jgi:hypothetical protein
MIKPHAEPAWADTQLAALRDQHPDWDFWYVHVYTGPTRGIFCARPAGAMISTCHGDAPRDITRAITDYENRLPEHTANARDELNRPGLHDDRRHVLQQQLAGMTRLRDATRARPAAARAGQRPGVTTR